MAHQQTQAQKVYGDIAPALADYSDKVLFGDVWERPGLSHRDRSLITVATGEFTSCAAQYHAADPGTCAIRQAFAQSKAPRLRRRGRFLL
jgi:hypothetical protein